MQLVENPVKIFMGVLMLVIIKHAIAFFHCFDEVLMVKSHVLLVLTLFDDFNEQLLHGKEHIGVIFIFFLTIAMLVVHYCLAEGQTVKKNLGCAVAITDCCAGLHKV